MVLVGVAAEDPDVDLADYLAPEAVDAASVIEDGCIGDIIAELPAVALAPDYFVTEPLSTPVGQEWLEANDPGQVASDAPMLLVQGGRDVIVLPARTDALFARLCALGQVVERYDIPTADHDTITAEASEQITTWIAARFAGEPATDDC
jgi:hypothetical protein